MAQKKDTYTVNLYPFKSHQLPDNPVNPGGESVAVCFSGGGSRALSAAMGQLRGLRHLGLIDKTAIISGVSGGAWASTVYSYVPEHISDDDLLGTTCLNPSSLTWNQHRNKDKNTALNFMPPNNIGRIPGRLGLAEFTVESLEMLADGIPAHEIWVRLIGKYVFKPYGLYAGYDTSKYFTYDECWFKGHIQNHNPELAIEDFYCFPQNRKRPHLLIFGSMIPHEAENDFRLLPFMFSPFYSGVMGEFTTKDPKSPDIGGGGVDSFALNSKQQQSIGVNLQTVEVPKHQFSLHDMAGISSAFYAEVISSEHSELDGILPVYPYWPVNQPNQNLAKRYAFADGGDLDNSGVASMLRQGTENIIAFLNTEVPLGYDKKLDLVKVDDQVPPLFGFQPYTEGYGYIPYKDQISLDPLYEVFRENQVFPEHHFAEYRNQIWNAAQAGGTALCYQPKLEVIKNKKFAVQAGTVNMLWVYNNPVKVWKQQLSYYVRLGMKLKFWLFNDFPNYKTIDLDLSKRQVNLLAQLSCWNVASHNTQGNPNGMTNRQMFERMYQKKAKKPD